MNVGVRGPDENSSSEHTSCLLRGNTSMPCVKTRRKWSLLSQYCHNQIKSNQITVILLSVCTDYIEIMNEMVDSILRNYFSLETEVTERFSSKSP